MPQRSYVMLEESTLSELVEKALDAANVSTLGLGEALAALSEVVVYQRVCEVVAHNDRGALRDTHKKCFADTDVPVLAAVSAKMFRPRPIPARRQVSV